MQKLVVVIMGQNCQRFLPMCLNSVKTADDIVFCDGGSGDNTRDIFDKFAKEQPGKFRWIENSYNQEDKGMNGKQRNFYLNYLKKWYPNDWALCLDADEVVEDLSLIKQFIQIATLGCYSVKMRHFEGDLGHEDAMTQIHWVLNRLFKISEVVNYPEVEHPVLIPKGQIGGLDLTTIWHLAYIPGCFELKKKYENHLKKSNMHSPNYLKGWYYSHLFGGYPKSQVNPEDIPSVILNEFGIDKDEIYFANRGIEVKHSIQVLEWEDYFKPRSVLDLGCGRGPYMFFWNKIGVNTKGIELSKYASQNGFTGSVANGNITDEGLYSQTDLITAIDVLEHLTNEELYKTLENMSKFGNVFIFSLPFIGDPNLDNDKTHKQFRNKEDWVKLIENYGIKVNDAPKEWLFSNQILIGYKTKQEGNK